MDWLQGIISGLFGGLITLLVLRYALLRAAQPRADRVIEYGRPMRVLAMVCLGIAGFVAYEALHARPDQRLIAYLLSTTMVLGSAYLVLEIFFVRIRFDDAAIYTFSPWRGARKIPWPAITGHSYSTLWHWHILETRGYGKVRLSFYLSGLGGLRDALISKLGESFREALICEVDEEDDHQD